MFLLIYQQVFTAVNTAISHFKGHKICFLEEKIVFMEANNIKQKWFKSLKITKISQNLAKQKKIICTFPGSNAIQ